MKIIPPSLPLSLAIPSDIVELFSDEDTVAGVRIENSWFTSADLEKTSISESLLSKADFSRVDVVQFDTSDCHFIGCVFTASKFPDSSWHRVVIDGARCTGTQLTNSTLKNVVFKNSKLELVNFRFSYLENVVFEDCALNDVDFYEAQLKNVEFIGCTINTITFANARMKSVDISRSDIEDIKGVSGLRGVTISYDQLLQLAPSLAAEAGIKIK